jgi:hypothetical protein
VGTGPRQLHGHAGRWGSARRPALQLQRRCRGRRVEAGPEKGVNKGDPPTPPTPSKPPGHAVDVLTPTLSRGTPNFHFHVPATFAAEQVTTFQRQFLGKVLVRRAEFPHFFMVPERRWPATPMGSADPAVLLSRGDNNLLHSLTRRTRKGRRTRSGHGLRKLHGHAGRRGTCT